MATSDKTMEEEKKGEDDSHNTDLLSLSYF